MARYWQQKKTTIMTRTLILLIGVLIISCNQNKKEGSKTNENSIELTDVAVNFDWLLGEWKRHDGETGKETFESWKKLSSSEYSGIGFTLQNGDTIEQERLKLIKFNGNWDLIVKVSEESESVIFKMTELKSDGFTCENDAHDFPKRIKYWKNGEKINALVSGDDLEIPFEFEKIK